MDVDLSRYSEGEPRKLWARLAPSQKASLRRVAYEMTKGDVIYVKHGGRIVGKGIVQDSYQYDSSGHLRDPYGEPWRHQVPVKWVPDFAEVEILLGAEQLTVKELSERDVRVLEAGSSMKKVAARKQEAIEGEEYTKEAIFRHRNRALIQAKKANSDFRCEVCGFNFQKMYGSIGREYIVAHHIRPVSSGVSKTTLDDLALLCANCHAMVHTSIPPITPQELRQRINREYSE
jgi:5-methylcytosine-specific restriction protein A